MTNLKKWIFMLIVILIILIGALIYVLSSNNGKISEEVKVPEETIYELDQSIQAVTIRNNYYIVKNCVNKYYTYVMTVFNISSYYGEIDKEVQAEAEKQNMNSLYNMLDSEYIIAKQVTMDNVNTKIQEIKSSIININDMYVSEKKDNMHVYIVNGTLREKTTNKISDFQIIVKVDMINGTFSIIPEEYVKEKYSNLSVGSNIEIQVPENIEKNTNNTYTFKDVSDENYVKDIFNQYKSELLYNSKLAYNHLETEYRNKKFSSIEEFQNNIKNNVKKYNEMQIKGYQKTEDDNYTQYVCVDKNENYYIFRENGVMNYSVILDTYTIDLPEFIEKYEDASEEQKVGYNIQKVFDAINDGNYRYAYSKLDNTFKTNNFKTQSEFEKYVKENFYTSNSITYDKCQKNGSLYMCDITIIDKTNANPKKVTKTVIMKLEEGTDFVMSFNIK